MSRHLPPALGTRTARGAIVHLGGSGIAYAAYFLQTVVVARYLTPEEVGLFALALAALLLTQQLKQFGIGQKLIQDRSQPVEDAFGVAFTLEVLLVAAAIPLFTGVAAFFVWWYENPELLPILATLSVLLLSGLLHLPVHLYARNLDFVRQRAFQTAGAVGGVVATIALVMTGFGVWALVLGRILGMVLEGLCLWSLSAARVQWRWDRTAFGRYVRFGAPIWGSRALGSVGEQGAVLAISTALGVGTLGFYHFAERLSARLLEVNRAMNAALYPALSVVQSTSGRFRNALEQSNRLLLSWAFPAGCGLALFAGDLVPLLFGDQWLPAVPLVRIWCVYTAVNAIGYNWNLFFQARGETRPRLLYAMVGSFITLGTLVPGIVFWEVQGIVGSMVIGMSVGLWLRQRLLRGIFPGFSLATVARGPVLATLAGVVVTVVLAEFGVANAGLQGGIYVVSVVLGLAMFERESLADMFRYLWGVPGTERV